MSRRRNQQRLHSTETFQQRLAKRHVNSWLDDNEEEREEHNDDDDDERNFPQSSSNLTNQHSEPEIPTFCLSEPSSNLNFCFQCQTLSHIFEDDLCRRCSNENNKKRRKRNLDDAERRYFQQHLSTQLPQQKKRGRKPKKPKILSTPTSNPSKDYNRNLDATPYEFKGGDGRLKRARISTETPSRKNFPNGLPTEPSTSFSNDLPTEPSTSFSNNLPTEPMEQPAPRLKTARLAPAGSFDFLLEKNLDTLPTEPSTSSNYSSPSISTHITSIEPLSSQFFETLNSSSSKSNDLTNETFNFSSRSMRNISFLTSESLSKKSDPLPTELLEQPSSSKSTTKRVRFSTTEPSKHPYSTKSSDPLPTELFEPSSSNPTALSTGPSKHPSSTKKSDPLPTEPSSSSKSTTKRVRFSTTEPSKHPYSSKRSDPLPTGLFESSSSSNPTALSTRPSTSHQQSDYEASGYESDLEVVYEVKGTKPFTKTQMAKKIGTLKPKRSKRLMGREGEEVKREVHQEMRFHVQKPTEPSRIPRNRSNNSPEVSNTRQNIQRQVPEVQPILRQTPPDVQRRPKIPEVQPIPRQTPPDVHRIPRQTPPDVQPIPRPQLSNTRRIPRQTSPDIQPLPSPQNPNTQPTAPLNTRSNTKLIQSFTSQSTMRLRMREESPEVITIDDSD